MFINFNTMEAYMTAQEIKWLITKMSDQSKKFFNHCFIVQDTFVQY